MAWKDSLRPASFRGVEFKVDTGSKAGGRRGTLFEFPKRDTPYFEDMGRRARRWAISGYVIGDDYITQADALEAALDREGSGLLVHPTMGEMQVECESYTRSERRTEGGMATFDMTFVQAGSPLTTRFTENTQGNVAAGANEVAGVATVDAGNGLRKVDPSIKRSV